MSRARGATVRACLKAIGVQAEDLAGCENVEQQWSAVKKSYFKNILSSHPDKGGDPEVFKEVQSAFEVIREQYDSGKVQSFTADTFQDTSTSDAFENQWEGFSGMPRPSYDYYADAAEESMPTYKVEIAKSSRSACRAKGKAKKCPEVEQEEAGEVAEEEAVEEEEAEDKKKKGPLRSLIGEGEVRIGWLNKQSGAYGMWSHLACWRVPSKVWLGLTDIEDPEKFEAALLSMNEVLLAGVGELEGEKRRLFVAHVMDRSNWAKLVKRKEDKEDEPKPAAASPPPSAANGAGGASGTVVPQAGPVVVKKPMFVIPRPDAPGAAAGCLEEKTVVLTGVFPMLPGGVGLNQGKDVARKMVESFGGRVTGSVSGKTDILLVGHQPGMKKVEQAREKGIALMTIDQICPALNGSVSLEAVMNPAAPLVIHEFSAGFEKRDGFNGLALQANEQRLLRAQGLAPPEIDVVAAPAEPAPGPAKAPAAKKKAAPKKPAAKKPAAKTKKPAAKAEKPAAKTKKPAAKAKKPAAGKKRKASDGDEAAPKSKRPTRAERAATRTG